VPPGLVFLNTKGTTRDGGEPLRTTFCFDPSNSEDLEIVGLVSDLGGHEPSNADELFAPFYPDASQRLLAVECLFYGYLLVAKAETFLRLVQEREGENLPWGEWKDIMTWVPCMDSDLWVSGPRLCHVGWTDSGRLWLGTYDFSAQASARRTETVEGGEVRRFATGVPQTLPWWISDIVVSCGCHDSLTFILVKTPRFSDLRPDPKLTEALHARLLRIRRGTRCMCGTLCDFRVTGTIRCRVSMWGGWTDR
jgi:hypothetical protein